MAKVLLIIISFFFLGGSSFAQGDASALPKAIMDLDAALMKKDSVAISRLLHEKLTYGHSNGWIETKEEVWQDLRTGKLVYEKIDIKILEIPAVKGETAVVRMKIEVKGKVNDTAFEMPLHVLQVWIWNEGRWVLFARQSTRI